MIIAALLSFMVKEFQNISVPTKDRKFIPNDPAEAAEVYPARGGPKERFSAKTRFYESDLSCPRRSNENDP
jgi:hypothetical protein